MNHFGIYGILAFFVRNQNSIPMKKVICLLIGFLLMGFLAKSQHMSGNSGKTYYDDQKTQLKEVYSYKTVTTLNPRSRGDDMEKEKVKDGRYFKYYKSGQLEISGRYKDGKKHSEWKFYNQEGVITKVVTYKNGKKVNTNKDPKQPDEEVKNAEEMQQELEEDGN